MWRPNLQSRAVYKRTARIDPWLHRLTAIVEGVDPVVERRQLLDHLDLESDHRVLEVGIGTGGNLPLIDVQLGPGGEVVGIDLTRAMLSQCQKRRQLLDCRSALIEATASQLPIRSDAFDAVFHFGGINAFASPAATITEMQRVARPDAKIVISDKSHPPERPRSRRQRLLLLAKPRLARPPPIDLIPLPNTEIEVTWFWDGAAYILSFSNPG